jgi:hypothetical protein
MNLRRAVFLLPVKTSRTKSVIFITHHFGYFTPLYPGGFCRILNTWKHGQPFPFIEYCVTFFRAIFTGQAYINITNIRIRLKPLILKG